jgi:hypothetical protein
MSKEVKKLGDLNDFEALKQSKFITRTDMEGWLAVLRDKHLRHSDWASVAPYISDFAVARKLHNEWIKYDTIRRSRFCAAALKFQAAVRQIAIKHITSDRTLLEGIDASLPEVRAINDQWVIDASDWHLRAIILYEYWHHAE